MGIPDNGRVPDQALRLLAGMDLRIWCRDLGERFGCRFEGDGKMIKHTPVKLAAFLLCSATVLLSAAPLAADEVIAEFPPDTDGGPAARAEWTIVATYPIPEGASGLAYDGTYLYCGIYGVNGGNVYRIDPNTGDYTLLFTGPQEDAYGLTYDGTYLWTTDHPGSSSVPAVAMQLDWDGTVLAQIDLPAHYMSGIAHDGGDFWVARYYPDPGHLYKVDTAGTVLDDFSAPDNQPWDLSLGQDATLWMADYWGDTLYQIDPKSGAVLYSHPSEGVDPAGVVWDGQFLWYCDNGEGGYDYLYKVDLAGGGTPQINVPITSHDFGPVAIGDSASWSITAQNTGTADLTITALAFDPAADLSSPVVFPVIIPPQESELLAVVYAPDDFAPLDATATVFSNDPIHPEVEVTLTGHGVYPDPTIDVPEDAHDYGPTRAGARTRWFMEVRNHGDDTLTISDIIIDEAHFSLDDTVSFPIHLSTLSSVDFGVWFNPDSAVSFAGTAAIYSNDPYQNPANVSLSGMGVEMQYPMGDELWSYLIDTDEYDNSPKAIAPIPDIDGDGVADVIVCSEDYYIRCFNGNADGTGDVLWEHEIYAGSVYLQNALQITEDVDGDGYADVVVGSAWGGRLIRTLSGKTGAEIWTHDTHEYGDGGWVYQVDCSFDYNGDGVVDVLASTGDDAGDIGPKRVYCLDGLTGDSIWETPLGGPGFAVIGVEDFTGDGQADAVAGASNQDETQGRAFGIDGADGSIEWTFLVSGTSVWALQQIDDITADGVLDVIIGDFSWDVGYVYGLDATNGVQEYLGSGYGPIIALESLEDVNGDGHPDVVPAHYGTTVRVVDGQTGSPIWSRSVVDKPSVVAASADLNDDGINDLIVGTLFTNNYAYFLDGADGTVLDSINYGTPVDAIGAIPDIVGDLSWEMVVGGRNGLVTCFSGGVGADCNNNGVPDWQDIADCAGDPACSDCNNNGLPDECDIADGTSLDSNGNGVPDECDCPGDLDGNWAIDLSDLAQLLSHYGTVSGASYADGDIDFDGDVDLADLAALLSVYGTTCP